MPTFDRFDVVSVPFPYTDRPVMQRRPACTIGVSDRRAVRAAIAEIIA
jgi:mRNA interferase MazF